MQTATKPQHLDMLNGPIWNKLPRYALPVAATGILGQLFNAADIAVVGNFTGDMRTAAVAAVGANSPVIGLLLNLFIGIALGANVVIANAIGRGDRETVHRAVHTSIVTALIGGVIVAIFGQFIAAGLMGLLNVPDDVYQLALAYLRIYLLGMPVILLYNFEAAIFRSVGDTKVPLIALTVSGVLNVILNLFFVIVLKMNVNGVAIATVLSNAVSSVLLLRRLLHGDLVRVELKQLRIDPAIFRKIMRIGLPAGIQSAIFSVSNIIIQSAINSLGTVVMAASSAAFNIEIIAYDVLNSFSQACTTFVGQNYGAGKIDRCKKTMLLSLGEDIIAWSYMDLLDRSTKNIQLSVSHKTLGELHPADIADIIEQLDPRLRAQVFAQLDTAQAAEAISEFDDDELMTEMLEGLSDTDASSMLAMMDPDDAADLIDELDYEKAEKLLRLMGVQEEKAIRNLLGYEDNTAGRIMTSEFVSLPATATVADAIEAIRKLDEDFESVYYVYTEDPSGMLTGVLSLRTLIVADRDATLGQLAYRDLVYVSPDDDQEDVTDEMTKYDLVAIPVCDENRHILGIVTFDDAMDVIAEEHQEDLQIAGVGSGDSASDDSTNVLSWFVHRQYWVVVWGIASCIMATVLGTALGSAHLVVFPMCAMPLVLLAASRMVSFVKNYFLEYDGHDDEPKPYLGFFFQSTGMGLILSLVTYLCAQLVRTAAFPDAPMFEEQLFTGCFNIAAIVCLIGNMSAVIYLMVLFWRDEHDLNTSGTAMNVIAVMISCVAYCIAAMLLAMSVMG